MKIRYLILVGIFGSALSSTAIEKTNAPAPPGFERMATNDVLPGFSPAVVYSYVSNKFVNRLTAIDTGFLYETSQTNFEVVMPSTIFETQSDFRGPYAVRQMRPDSGSIVLFIDHVIRRYGTGVAICTLGSNQVVIPRLENSENSKIIVAPHASILMRGGEVKRLTSLITGKDVRIAGYGCPFNDEDVLVAGGRSTPSVKTMVTLDMSRIYPFVEARQDWGDGGLFFDEYGRLYVVRRGFQLDDGNMENVRKDFAKRYGHRPANILALSEPVKVDVRQH